VEDNQVTDNQVEHIQAEDKWQEEAEDKWQEEAEDKWQEVAEDNIQEEAVEADTTTVAAQNSLGEVVDTMKEVYMKFDQEQYRETALGELLHQRNL
jgi:hypothetical protein